MKPYVNCKIEALGNTLEKFNRDYRVLLNNLILFLYIDDNVLKIGTSGYESFEQLFLKNGLLIKRYPKVENIQEVLKNNLSEKSVVVIKTDLFYQPYSLKYYNKIHRTHNLYISRYDFKTDMVEVVEQEYSGSDSYIEMKFDITKIEELYYGYLENFYYTNIDLEDTVLIIELKEEKTYIPTLRESYNNDILIFSEYFKNFNNYSLNERNESLTIAIRLKKIKQYLTCDKKEKEYIQSQIKCLNRIKKSLIKQNFNMVKQEIGNFMKMEKLLFEKLNIGKAILFRFQDKIYVGNERYKVGINSNLELNYNVSFITDSYVICDINSDISKADKFYVDFDATNCIKILKDLGMETIKENEFINLRDEKNILKKMQALNFDIEHINYQNNSINGYLIKSTEKYFFKILSKKEAQNELVGYLTIVGKMPVAELLKIIEYKNCVILVHEFDKNIGNNSGLLNDLIVQLERENIANINNTILNVIQEYTKNWNIYMLKANYPMEKFFKNRIDSRLLKWYENSDFIDFKVIVNNEYAYNIRNILNETKKYFNNNPMEKCVLTQGDPNLLNIGIKPIFFDYSTSGYNALYGEISAFLWSMILADAYLCPKYHRASYYNHDNILNRTEIFKPEIKIEFNNKEVLINIRPKTTGIRKNVIKLLIKLLKNYEIDFNLKYFLVMRLLCVLNIENMEFDDKWYVLALVVLFYCKIGNKKNLNLEELLDFFEEV